MALCLYYTKLAKNQKIHLKSFSFPGKQKGKFQTKLPFFHIFTINETINCELHF